VAQALKVLEEGPLVGPVDREGVLLPPGCEVTYDLQVVSLLRSLLRPSAGQDTLRAFYEEFRQRQGLRPRAAEAWHAGYNPRAAGARHGSWLGLVRAMGDLDGLPDGRAGAFLRTLESVSLGASGSLVLLRAMLDRQALPGSVPLQGLAEAMARVARRNVRLLADLEVARPGAAWEGHLQAFEGFLEVEGADLRCRFPVPAEERQAYAGLVEELVEWRLAEYLGSQVPTTDLPAWQLKVSHAGGRGILRLPGRDSHPDLPLGEIPVQVDGQTWVLHFVKVAVNVGVRSGGDGNCLPTLLRGWFGPQAGLPGTHHRVLLEKTAQGYRLSPLTPQHQPPGPVGGS